MTTYTLKDRQHLEDLIDKQATSPPPNSFSQGEADPGLESTLSKRIRQYCRDHGWPALIFPQTQDVRNFLPAGWPDAHIILHNRNVFLELKKPKGGRKSKEQDDMAIRFLHLGHKIHEVKTWKRFIEIIYGKQ